MLNLDYPTTIEDPIRSLCGVVLEVRVQLRLTPQCDFPGTVEESGEHGGALTERGCGEETSTKSATGKSRFLFLYGRSAIGRP